MPEVVWLYLTTLPSNRTSGSCMVLVEALETVTHDRLTRLLQAGWSGHTRLDLAVCTLCIWTRGYLMLGDAVIPEPLATAMEGLGRLQPGVQARLWVPQ
jgi:hypothetical protein